MRTAVRMGRVPVAVPRLFIGNATTPRGRGSFCRLPACLKYPAKFMQIFRILNFLKNFWKFQIAKSISTLLKFCEIPAKFREIFDEK